MSIELSCVHWYVCVVCLRQISVEKYPKKRQNWLSAKVPGQCPCAQLGFEFFGSNRGRICAWPVPLHPYLFLFGFPVFVSRAFVLPMPFCWNNAFVTGRWQLLIGQCSGSRVRAFVPTMCLCTGLVFSFINTSIFLLSYTPFPSSPPTSSTSFLLHLLQLLPRAP